MKMMLIDLAQWPKPSRTFPVRVSLCYYKAFAFFFFFGTRLAFRGLQSIGRDSLNAMLGTHPPPPHLKALLQLVSSGVSVMMGEDVLRGSLTTSGLSQQMSSKGEIGGIFRDYVHLKKPP